MWINSGEGRLSPWAEEVPSIPQRPSHSCKLFQLCLDEEDRIWILLVIFRRQTPGDKLARSGFKVGREAQIMATLDVSVLVCCHQVISRADKMSTWEIIATRVQLTAGIEISPVKCWGMKPYNSEELWLILISSIHHLTNTEWRQHTTKYGYTHIEYHTIFALSLGSRQSSNRLAPRQCQQRCFTLACIFTSSSYHSSFGNLGQW